MIVTIHQPEHLPWLGFFDKMRQADMLVLLDTTQFAKNDFQNRNRIKTRSGSSWLTVPVFSKGASKQSITDVEICNDGKWGKRCWSLIYENYREAPYFARHKPFFEELYARKWSKLADLNVMIIQYLTEQLGLKTELVTASELGIYGRGATSVLVTICRSLGADVYLSGKYGKQYLDETQFVEHNIEVRYQDFQHPIYPQLWGEFLSHMSAIDLLCNCGDSSLEIIAQANSPGMLTEYHLMPLERGN